MPIGVQQIEQGRVYVTEDYTYVQVLAKGATSVHYRERERNPILRILRPRLSMALTAFAEFVKAEVNGEHFPDFVDLRSYTFERSEREKMALDRFMAARAGSRPFVSRADDP